MGTSKNVTIKQLALLAAVAGLFALVSFYSAPLSSIELSLSLHSPAGENGGAVMPASCPSYAHTTGQCGGIETCNAVTQPSPQWGGRSGQCVASCSQLGGTQCLSNGVSCPNGTYSRGASYDCDVCCGATALAACPFTANGVSQNLTINGGATVTLAWNCTSPSTSASGLNFSTGNAPSGHVDLTPSSSTSYVVQCNAACSPSTINVTVNYPTISIVASPTRVKSGQASTITWSSSQVTSCAVTGPNFSASGTSGARSTGTIVSGSSYVLTCQSPGGVLTASVNVTLVPSQTEI